MDTSVSKNDYDSKLQELQQKVSEVSGDIVPTTPPKKLPKSSKKSNFTLKPIYLYSAVPIIVFIILIILRPGCVQEETPNPQNPAKPHTKLSITKLVIWGVVICAPLILAVYLYFSRTTKKE